MCKKKFSTTCNRKTALRGWQTPIGTRLRQFREEEDGVATLLTLLLLIVFLMMGGIGIDLMRHEMRRTHLAAVSDAASLAGANATSEAQAKEIVRDYFAKNGMTEYLKEFQEGDVQITLNTAKVTVNSSMTMDTYLMSLAGVDTLGASATATAEKRVPKLEISLVLDVSGSMDGVKLTELKAAAKEFVTTIIDSADPGDAVISIIPFSFGVTPSQELFNALSVQQTHNYSTCIVFNEDDFGDVAISPTTTYAQQIYTSRYDVNGDFDTLNSSWRSCYTDDYFQILPYSISKTALHNKIESLQADGNTSGNLGIKWGAGLLDPAFQPVVTSLINANAVSGTLTNVPAAYNELATQKVIVMMGDGANTSSYYFNDPNDLLDPSTAVSHAMADYRGPDSDLWEVEYLEDGDEKTAYFLYSSRYNDYTDIDDVVDNDDVASEGPYLTQAEFDNLENLINNNSTRDLTYEDDERLNWETAWGLMSPDYHKATTGVSTAYSEYVNQETVTGSMKNTRMKSACTASKAKDIVIYTIGFDVPEGGTAETELKSCANVPSQYYRASTSAGDEDFDIGTAFGSIASNIQNLRLTQ